MQGKSFAMIALLALTSTAGAQELSYRNVDFAFLPSAEIDDGGGNLDGDGFLLRGMLPVYENFFVLAEFESLDFDFDVDTTRFAVGAGGHWPLSSNVDIIGRIGLARFEIDAGNFDDDDSGIFLGGRLRSMITPQFELEGGVEYYQIDVGGIENQTVLVGEARYHFTPQWSAGLLINIGSDINNFGVHARWAF